MDKPNTENVMALAFELAETRQRFGPQHPDYRAQVIALRTEVERLAAQAAPTEQYRNSDIGHLVEQEMAMLIRRLCSTTANDKTRAQAMEYLFKRGHASPLRAESEPAQAMDHPPLPEGVKARFKCEDCGGTGYTGDMIPGSEFQPPEPVGCTSCNFTGWWAECEAYSADQMHAYLDADRASTVAALKAERDALRARVAELEKDTARLEFVCNSPNRMVERENGLWRVYEDVAPTDRPTAVWQGITPRWHVTPREAIDAAITAALTKGQP